MMPVRVLHPRDMRVICGVEFRAMSTFRIGRSLDCWEGLTYLSVCGCVMTLPINAEAFVALVPS